VRGGRPVGKDLGSLRIFDPDHPELASSRRAPWFMSPFGTRLVLTAWMAADRPTQLAWVC